MKISGAWLRPSLCSSISGRPHLTTTRAYSNFGTALRLLDKRTKKCEQREGLNIQRLSNHKRRDSRPFGTSHTSLKAADGGGLHTTNAEPDGRWPRLEKSVAINKSCREFNQQYGSVLRGETEPAEIQVYGRIWSFRVAGNKLAFVDLLQDGVKLQVVCNFQDLASKGVETGSFKQFIDGLKRGDVISITGRPHRTQRNELSVLAVELPRLLSTCLRPLPTELKNEEVRMRLRHVDLLIRPRAAQIIKLASEIKKFLRDFLERDDHVAVKTPILAAAAGGAIAQPFAVKASGKRNMALRIAPELWLKRLIVGGFERIYEIGPCFRDEGVDLVHNPEFETCEFYRAYTDLEELISITEKMFSQMSTTIKVLEPVDFTPPYERLDFIPALEAEMGCTLPKLDDRSLDPVPILVKMMKERSIKLPAHGTLNHLLDRLCSHYLEPKCQSPTWIIHPPECLSPLSKSFTHEANGQTVAARAELFVRGQEIVNTYEEENSPVMQRQKFARQLELNGASKIDGKLDESYLEVLEYGMPPTGGWGCGIERLTMLFGGTKRIADTLSFGSLKNVVALGSHRKDPNLSSEEALDDSIKNSNQEVENEKEVAGTKEGQTKPS